MKHVSTDEMRELRKQMRIKRPPTKKHSDWYRHISESIERTYVAKRNIKNNKIPKITDHLGIPDDRLIELTNHFTNINKLFDYLDNQVDDMIKACINSGDEETLRETFEIAKNSWKSLSEIDNIVEIIMLYLKLDKDKQVGGDTNERRYHK